MSANAEPATKRSKRLASRKETRSEPGGAELRRSEEAAHERVMRSGLHRAECAARRLAEIRGEPKPRPVPALAIRADGKTLLSLAYLEGADLAGSEHWIGVVLADGDAGGLLDRVSGAYDDAAAHIAADILRKGSSPGNDREIGGTKAD